MFSFTAEGNSLWPLTANFQYWFLKDNWYSLLLTALISFKSCLILHLKANYTTCLGWTSCYQVPDYPYHSQSHDAGYAEDHAHQAVVKARDVTSNPGMVKCRGNGQRIHAEGHADVCYSQVHCQQLWSFEQGETTCCIEQDCCIPQNRQDGCRNEKGIEKQEKRHLKMF